MNNDKLAQQFKALSEPTRLKIINLLPATRNCASVYNVSELAEELGIPQPTVSRHLKILHQAGLVKCARMCRDVYYWINQPVVETALSDLEYIINNRGGA